MKVSIQGENLDLPSGFSIEIEETNPVYNDRGSQSIPVNVPVTKRNCRLLAAPHRLDSDTDPNFPGIEAELSDGTYNRRGIMNVTEAGTADGIMFNIGFDNSTAYAKWQKMKLRELPGLPTYYPDKSKYGTDVEILLTELYRIYKNPVPGFDNFAVFPVAVNKESKDTDNDKTVYWEMLNVAGKSGLELLTSVTRIIDGEVTQVSVPEGYGVSPFLRVWRVLELIFEGLGVAISANPFKDDAELARLVVLNNTADAICTGKIKYADLMPDCTVEEFLNALWVRFGLVYNIDDRTGIVKLAFIKDIISQPQSKALDDCLTSFYKITYETKQYIKLAAKTSIEGAAPGTERFEDFIKGVKTASIHLGNHVSQWQNIGTQDAPRWDGDVNREYEDPWEDYDPDIDFPDIDIPDQDDPSIPEPDDRDPPEYGEYSLRSISAQSEETSTQNGGNSFVAKEFITGLWYKLDGLNGKIQQSSTSFFNWDPQPEGLEALELSSADEFIPLGRVSTHVGSTSFNDICPLYLVGARHYHSYIKGSDNSGSDGDSTPPAFMLAYTKDNATIGRLTPEGSDGLPLTLDDGSTPTLSLLFQFKDGLFAKFWAAYDEILRHGNRSVEINARINKIDIQRFSLLDVYSVGGIRCLIDTMTYSLPAGRNISVDLKLRTIQPQGVYDIAAEQAIPDFSAATRHLEWRILADNYGTGLDTADARALAAANYIKNTGYSGHGVEGNYWLVNANSAVLKEMSKAQPTWETDKTMPAPTDIRQKLTRKYKAILRYDIFEVHDMSLQGEPEDWELEETSIGQATALVEYTVILAPKWVAD